MKRSALSLVANVGALLVVFGVAVALRVYGLRWGLPDSLHSYSYHPDEFLSVNAAFRIYHTHSFDPGIYVYPSLYMYLSALAIAVGLGYGAVPSLAFIYLAARVMTVVMGVAAVGATWWAGKTLFGSAIGLVAALVMCLAPLHVQHSHFATVDVPSTLFVAAALGFAGLIMNRGLWHDYAIAGMLAGLAAGTKYNAGLVILAVLASHFLRRNVEKDGRWLKSIAAVACAAMAFVVSTPGSLLRYEAFRTDFLSEVSHVSTGHGLVFAGTGNGIVYNFVSSLWYGLGPALAVVLAISVVWALARFDRRTLAIMAFLIPYYVLISLSQVRFARYTLPVYPAVALLVAFMVVDVYSLLAQRKLIGIRVLWVAATTGMLLFTLWYAGNLTSVFGRTDPRDQAARWIFAHIPRGARIGVLEVPWFYSPPLSKMLGYGKLSDRQEALREAPYELVVFRLCDQYGYRWFDGFSPRWVIVSNYEIDDALRLRKSKSIGSAEREEVRRIVTDFELVKKHYRCAARFGEVRGWFSGLPHDMRYPLPTLTIYELRR